MESTIKYLDENSVSNITGIALSSLRNQRHERRGIPFCKIGRSIRYKLTDIEKYMDDRRIETS